MRLAPPTSVVPLLTRRSVIYQWPTNGPDGRPRIDLRPETEEVTVGGGMSWPVPQREGDKSRAVGAAVVVAKTDREACLWIMAEIEYNAVLPLTHEGRIVDVGIASWLADQWARLRCRRYYCGQSRAISERNARHIRDSAAFEPKPIIVNIEHQELSVWESVMWQHIGDGTMAYKRNGLVHDAITRRQVETEKSPPSPLLSALIWAVAGMDRKHPEHSVDPDEIRIGQVEGEGTPW